VKGNQIVDANGNIVRLQGTNMAGTEFVCSQGWSSDPFGGQPEDTAQTFAAMRSWHVNAVRVPLNEDCWLGINGATIGGAAYQSAIIKLVHDLRAAGFYVIVDLHWTAPGTQLALSQNPAPDEDHSPAF
jgi:endoglucanase